MKIDFEFQTQYGKFADALWFADDQVPDDVTIEAMKQQRLDKWIDSILNPPPPPVEVIEEVVV
jgi:hypothetical protein